MDTTTASQPVTGADLTVGLSPDTMHVDPTTQVPYYDQAVAAQQAALTAQQASTQTGPSLMTLVLLAGAAWLAYYGWHEGWFDGLLKSLGIGSGGSKKATPQVANGRGRSRRNNRSRGKSRIGMGRHSPGSGGHQEESDDDEEDDD